MAITRQRSVSPEAFMRPELLELPPAVRLTEIGLRLYADDQGRGQVKSALLCVTLFPLDADEHDMDTYLVELAEAGSILLYDVDGSTFYQLCDWPAVQHAKPSRYPQPPPVSTPHAHGHGGGGRERERGSEGESESASEGHHASPPSPFCPAHRATGGTDSPCRACGRARNQRKVWDDEQMSGNSGPTFEPEQ